MQLARTGAGRLILDSRKARMVSRRMSMTSLSPTRGTDELDYNFEVNASFDRTATRSGLEDLQPRPVIVS